jgi:two-component system, OmpR family, copper resistance phosphate regulon response regulator CusR
VPIKSSDAVFRTEEECHSGRILTEGPRRDASTLQGRESAFPKDATTVQGADMIGPVRILVVEDEQKVAKALQEGLEGERYEVVVAQTGEDAFFRINTEKFDVILLDLMLPGRDGLQILTTARKAGLDTPVILLTARDTVEDRINGLNSGADDYLVKPFAFAELLARIRALIRRRRPADSLRLSAADLEMDLVTRKVMRAGRNIELTAREFELLEYLLRREGQVVLRETLARDIWKETDRGTPLNNVIDVHIARLRRKIDLDHPVKLIHTVRGAGFMLGEEEQ